MLNFLGRGAAFNPKEGNTSAFIIENENLFLIDCGESVFERLMASGILNTVSNISVFITHTHSDHIGSIGSLAMYSYFVKKQPLKIMVDESVEYLSNIEKILEGFGCTTQMVSYINTRAVDNKFENFEKVRYVPTSHCDELKSCGIMFDTKTGVVYYSGDTREMAPINNIINSQAPIDKIYVDANTADYPGAVHLSLKQLNESIPQELRDRVYCMHFNNDDCIVQAQELGFQTVEVFGQQKGITKKLQKQ